MLIPYKNYIPLGCRKKKLKAVYKKKSRVLFLKYIAACEEQFRLRERDLPPPSIVSA